MNEATVTNPSEAPAAAPSRAVRANRKADIIACFADLVAERGYDEVSLRDIAEQLNMSKGTILHHFGSKERMLERLHADYMVRRLAELHAIFAEIETPTARLSAVVHQLMIAEADDRSATVAFAREIVRFSSEASMEGVRAMRDEYTGLLSGVIRQGMDDGIFRVGDPDIVTLQIFGMCNWSWTWFRPGGRWSAEEIAGEFVATLLNGIRREDAVVSGDELAAVPGIVRAAMAATAA